MKLALSIPVLGQGTSILRPLVEAFRNRRRRHRFADLQQLDDHLLRDIGLTRDDIGWGLSLPLREDAALLVRRRMAQRMPAGSREPTRFDAVNAICPWTGRPVSSSALTRYRGHVVGFASPDSRHEFDRARRAFDRAIVKAS